MAGCPHCGCTCGERAAAPSPGSVVVGEAELRLRTRCAIEGIPILPDDTIREAGAARFMGCSAKRLQNRRYDLDNTLPPHVVRSHRAYYSITGLAAWLSGRK